MTMAMTTAKRLFRRMLRSQHWDITPVSPDNGSPLPVLSVLIDYIVRVEGPKAILEIGANDGVSMRDPVHGSILRLGLPALLVEPLPDIFAKLQTSYAGCPNVQFANLAVSDEPGEAEIFRINPAATGLPGWVQGLASFKKSVLVKHATAEGVDRARFLASIESLRVPVVTVASLLEQYPVENGFAVLQIDTEGHDLHVVRSAVAAKCLPRIINYEHKHLSYADQVACRELLAAHGYSFWSAKPDTLAVRLAGLMD